MSTSTSWVSERLSVSAPAGAVDRVRGVVKNVRLVGPVSVSWGRKYPVHVLAAAVRLFNGVPSNLGHSFDYQRGQPVPVPPEKVFGKILGPRVHGDGLNGDGLNGDLKYIAAHQFATPFTWACENEPTAYSFSPLMNVRWEKEKDRDGFLVAAEIIQVLSVDVVDKGGTTESVFESWNRRVGAEIPTVVAESAHAARLRSAVAGLVAGTDAPSPSAPPRPVSAADLVAGFDPSGSSWRG